MPATKPEYEVVEEFSDIAKKVIEKYPEVFHGLDVGEIRCVSITNKDRKDNDDNFWQVMPVKMPVRSDCQFGWYIIVYATDWEGFDDRHKNILVASALCSIPKDETEIGKTLPPDYKDYAVMLRTFGPDYLQNDDTPDILEDDIKWVTA